jgi:D-glycerate 3-kinase
MLTNVSEKLSIFAAVEGLPASYVQQVDEWFLPLAMWLCELRDTAGGTILVGINGAQGTGKTTLCKVLEMLTDEAGWRSLTVSLDDYYFSHDVRQRLAEAIHPLLATRGVPGTHDIPLLLKSLDALRNNERPRMPRFDKATDDREPEKNWPKVTAGVDIILLEGWCIGCRPETEEALLFPVNSLEEDEDVDQRWRRHVNACLAGDYADLFRQLDALVMLEAPSMHAVLDWRKLQERKLQAQRRGDAVMDEAELDRFVQHYERITRHSLEEMPARADYVLTLAENHQVVDARVQ